MQGTMDKTIETLYEQLHKELVQWCSCMTMDAGEAEELVQEGFLRAMSHVDELKTLEFKQQRSYMYRTIKHLFIDRYRKRRYEVVSDDLLQLPMTEIQFSNCEWEQLLSRLPGLEGAIFTMRYVHEMNSTQIGEVLHLPPGTVRSKLSSARQHLRDMMK